MKRENQQLKNNILDYVWCAKTKATSQQHTDDCPIKMDINAHMHTHTGK